MSRSRWDALRDDEDRSHRPGSAGGRGGNYNVRLSSSSNRRRSRPGGSGGATGNRPGEGGKNYEQASWRSSRSDGGGSSTIRSVAKSHPDASFSQRERQGFDETLNILREHLSGMTSGGGDVNAETLQQCMTALHQYASSDSDWFGTDPKRVGETTRILFKVIDYVTGRSKHDADLSFCQSERSIYDTTTKVISIRQAQYWRGDEKLARMPHVSAETTNACIMSLVSRIKSITLAVPPGETAYETTATSAMDCLCAILTEFGSILAAEATAENVVWPLLLPILESNTSGDTCTARSDGDLRGHVHVLKASIPSTLDCFSGLLRHKQHSSAILAPLILDISNNGEERQVDNPLRFRLLASLQGLMLHENEDQIILHCCDCLCIALGSIHFLDRSSKVGGKELYRKESTVININIQALTRRIRTLLERGSVLEGDPKTVRWHALKLLASLARTCPRGTAAQWALFLEEDSTAYDLLSSPASTVLLSPSRSACSQLVSFIRGDGGGSGIISERERVATIGAIKALLSAMPLKLWFGMNSRRGTRQTFTGPSSLSNRVSKALQSIFMALHGIVRSPNQVSDEFVVEACSLIETIILTEPFDVDDALALILTDVLAELSNGLAVGLSSSSVTAGGGGCNVAHIAIVKALAKGIGGTITPKGLLIQLSKPAKYWLDRNESHDFLSEVFALVSRDDRPTRIDTSLEGEVCNLIMRILRMSPGVSNGSIWTPDYFSESVQNLLINKDSTRRLLGLQLIRHFIQGRNDFCADRSSYVCDSFCPYLLCALGDSNAAVRASSAACYGFLLRSDWERLFRLRPSSEQDSHFQQLLRLCINGESSETTSVGEPAASVRSEACKAIGNLCTECVGLRDSSDGEIHLIPIVRDVTDAMLVAVQDKNAGVRSMALFAVGNLSLSLQTSLSPSDNMSDCKFPALCQCVRNCIDDKSERVVNNAVRSAGHLLNFLRLCDKENRTQSEALYRETIKILTSKLDLALDILTRKATNLSWKQRSFAKKHSWGACHTLGALLQHASSADGQSNELFLPAIFQMIRCLRLSNELNEKVVAAATAALKLTPIDIWRNFSSESTIVGDGLAACLMIVYHETSGEKKLSPQVCDDARILLQTFLTMTSAIDAVASFSRDDISAGMLDFLYSWMVAKGSKSTSFDAIAIAVSNHRSEFDISIEQRFSSRAKHERRREGSPKKVSTTPSLEGNMVSVGDEAELAVHVQRGEHIDYNDELDEEDEL